MAKAATSTATRSPAQTLSLVVGIVYVLIGLAGFFVVQTLVGDTDEKLLLFETNGLHNIVHLAIGAAGIALARTLAGARTYGLALLVAYGLVAIYGFFTVPGEAILSLNAADNWLHLFSAVVGAVILALTGRSAARG